MAIVQGQKASYSANGGETLASPLALPSGAFGFFDGEPRHDALLLDASGVLLAAGQIDTRAFVWRSSDLGQHWFRPTLIAGVPPITYVQGIVPGSANIAIRGQRVLVSYGVGSVRYGFAGLWGALSANRGASFGRAFRLARAPDGGSVQGAWSTCLAARDFAIVAWQTDAPDRSSNWFAEIDHGKIGAAVSLSGWTGKDADTPPVVHCFDDGRYAIAWATYGGLVRLRLGDACNGLGPAHSVRGGGGYGDPFYLKWAGKGRRALLHWSWSGFAIVDEDFGFVGAPVLQPDFDHDGKPDRLLSACAASSRRFVLLAAGGNPFPTRLSAAYLDESGRTAGRETLGELDDSWGWVGCGAGSAYFAWGNGSDPSPATLFAVRRVP